MELLPALFADLSLLRITTISAVVILAWRCLTRKSYRLPPGPFSLPLLGNILEFRNTSAIDKFNEWYKKFGPVVTFYLGPKRAVVLNTYEAVTEALVTQGSDFSGRPWLYSTSLSSEGHKNILFASYGELWKYQRRIASHALRQYLTGTQLEQRVHESLQQIIELLRSEKGAFDPHKILNLCMFKILSGLCFGKSMSVDDPDFLNIMRAFDETGEEFGYGFLEDFIPPLRWWPTKRLRRTMDLYIDHFVKYIHREYREHKDNFSEENLNSLTDQIISAHQILKEENPTLAAQFTETHAVHVIGDVFLAGVDTSRQTLDWFFLVMAGYPEVQKKIQNEIDDVVGRDIPGKEHRSKLVYLEAALLETMRMYYVVPIGLPHETIRDTTVGGYEIPAKTIVVSNTYGILHDAKYWEEPTTFKPERFMNETGDKLTARHKGWFPFSMGHRSCLGESLAKLELVYIIAGLLQALTFTLPPGVKPDFTSTHLGLFNLRKRYQIMVTRRETM